MRRAAVAATLLTLAVTAGCSANLGGTGDKGYVEGKGGITQLAPDERSKPGDVRGETLDGNTVDLAQYAGKIVVINVWGSWCPPCRAEVGDLKAAYEELKSQDVVFLGINTKDLSKETALAFQREREVPYPSIFDPGGRNLLAFRNTLTPSSIPSTVIIDEQGRVAASVLGTVTKTTLVDLVEDVTQ